MRWTVENEQILFKTIFETCNIDIDLGKLAEAWPDKEKPSPKALAEQLKKARKNAQGNITLAMPPKRKADGDETQNSPRKKGSPKKDSPKKGNKKTEGAKGKVGSGKKVLFKEEGEGEDA